MPRYAIAKAKYKANKCDGLVKYIIHRQSEFEKYEGPREAFNQESDSMDSKQAIEYLRQFEKEDKCYTYQVVVSPNPDYSQNVDMRKLAQDFMDKLNQESGKDLKYVAVIHTDHTNIDHLHIAVHVDVTLRDNVVKNMEKIADRLVEKQVELNRDHYYEQEVQPVWGVEEDTPQYGEIYEQGDDSIDNYEDAMRIRQIFVDHYEKHHGTTESQHKGGEQERQAQPSAEQAQETQKPQQRGYDRYDGIQWENTTRQQDSDERWLASRPSLITSGAAVREFAERYRARQEWIAKQQAERKAKREEERDKWKEKGQKWRDYKQEVREAAKVEKKIQRDWGYGR